MSFEKVIREFYGFAIGYNRGLSWVIVERLQLYNRFFPILVFAFIISFSIMLLENKFEKFIFVVFLVMNLYWILFFNFVTYRHLFMGIIPACFLLTKILIFVYSELSKRFGKRITLFKIFALFSFFIFFAYGASTNLIYSIVGYNDGVQFDLDGYQSRLGHEIKPDLKQQTFYNSLNNYINTDDIIFSDAPQIANFYVNNRVYTLNKINDFNDSLYNRYIIISREAYPNILSNGINKIKDLNIKEIYSIQDFYLFKLLKNN